MEIKINGKHAQVERSGRGYVMIRARGHGPICIEMDEKLKFQLENDPHAWNAEMDRLEQRVIEQARKVWKD